MIPLESTVGWLRWAAVLCGLVASVAYVREFVGPARRPWPPKLALVWATTGLMTAVLVLRGLELGTVPLVTSLEALFFYAWLLLVVFLGLVRSTAHRTLGALVVPLASILALVATALWQPPGEVNALFRNRLFAVHTVSAFLGYSALSIAFCAGVLYLLLFDEIAHKRVGRMFARLPSLDDLDRLGHATVVLGFLCLTIGIVTGAFWARREWGVAWVWEPKSVWTLLSWALYAGYLVARRLAGWQGSRAAWLAAVGFASSIFSFLGTNYLLGTGRHVF